MLFLFVFTNNTAYMSQKLYVMHEVAAMAAGCESTQKSLLRNGNSDVIHSSELLYFCMDLELV